MGILDKLLGRDDAREPERRGAAPSADEQAIARYRYMLQTAPPQTIEQAHTEAFAKLTPDQRALLLQQLAAEMPEAERAAAGSLQDNPQSLARLATRAEVRQPGTLERSFGGIGARAGGIGLGGMMAGSFLASMAGMVVGSAIAQSFLADAGGDVAADQAVDGTGGEVADAGDAGDFGGGDIGDMGDV